MIRLILTKFFTETRSTTVGGLYRVCSVHHNPSARFVPVHGTAEGERVIDGRVGAQDSRDDNMRIVANRGRRHRCMHQCHSPSGAMAGTSALFATRAPTPSSK